MSFSALAESIPFANPEAPIPDSSEAHLAELKSTAEQLRRFLWVRDRVPADNAFQLELIDKHVALLNARAERLIAAAPPMLIDRVAAVWKLLKPRGQRLQKLPGPPENSPGAPAPSKPTWGQAAARRQFEETLDLYDSGRAAQLQQLHAACNLDAIAGAAK